MNMKLTGDYRAIATGSGLAGVKEDISSTERKNEEKLKEVCRDFEAIFIFQILKAMRSTVPQSGLIKATGRHTYEMMMDQKLAEDMAKKGEGLGLSKILYNQLSKHVTKTTKDKM